MRICGPRVLEEAWLTGQPSRTSVNVRGAINSQQVGEFVGAAGIIEAGVGDAAEDAMLRTTNLAGEEGIGDWVQVCLVVGCRKQVTITGQATKSGGDLLGHVRSTGHRTETGFTWLKSTFR